MRWGVGASLLGVMLATGPLAGQAPSCGPAVATLRDSLAAADDLVSLRLLHRATRRAADSLAGDLRLELRLGFIGIRLGELTDEGRYWSEASRTLEWVTRDHPDCRLGWLGFGLAAIGEARTSGAAGFGLQRMLGMDPAGDIVATLVRSAGPDLLDGQAAIEVGQLALRSREPVAEDVALRTVRALPVEALARDPDLALIRARLEREIGEKDSAVAVTELAARLHQHDARILRAQAMMRFVTGRNDGAVPWYRGLREAEGEPLRRFRRDLQVVVPDSVMTRFDRVPAGERERVIRDHWASQDADGLPTEDDRLAEHYRRLAFARHNYVRTTIHQSGLLFEFDTLGVEALDRRGEIMLLHGSPTKRTSLGGHGGPDVDEVLRVVGMPPNESWRYRRTDEVDQFYHFLALDKASDFQTVESIFDILAQSSQYRMFRSDQPQMHPDSTPPVIRTYGAELVSTIAQELMQSRRRLSPIYTEILNQGRDGADSLQRLERAIGRESLARPYSYELGFELPLNAGIDVLALGSDQRGPILQVAFALDAADLTPRDLMGGRQLYPIRFRVAVRGLDGVVAAVIDTVRGFVTADRLRPGQHLLGQLPIRVPAGEYRVRVAIESDRRGTVAPPVVVRVPDPTDRRLTLSDLSLGVRSVSIPWRSPSADTAWANPLGRFSQDEPMQLYFEVGGLGAGTSYQAQLAIDRLAGVVASSASCSGRGEALTIVTTRRHPGVVDRVHTEVQLNRLSPGTYMLTATMSTAEGLQVVRCRRFTVIE